jgi:hypothetical protein
MDEEEIGPLVMRRDILDPPPPAQFNKVARLVKNYPGYTKRELWERIPLPRGIFYTEFDGILCHLITKNMIAKDQEGHYCWIYNPELTRRYMSQPELSI